MTATVTAGAVIEVVAVIELEIVVDACHHAKMQCMVSWLCMEIGQEV